MAYLTRLDESTGDGEVIVGHSELIFYKKTFPSSALASLSPSSSAKTRLAKEPLVSVEQAALMPKCEQLSLSVPDHFT